MIRPGAFDITPQSASVKVGTTYQIPYTITPSDARNKKVIWTSSDDSIATVSNNGLISAIDVGNITITGRTEDLSLTDSISIETYVIHTTGVMLNKSSATLYQGETVQLVATVAPADTSFPQVTWSSSNSNVATVSSNGLVNFVGVGSCTITVTTVDGGYTATCSIICDEAQPVSVTFSYTGADQQYTIPYTQCYKLEARGAGSNTTAGGYASGTMRITKGTVYKIMVGQSGSSKSGTTYGFGGSSNYGSNRAGGGLSGIFTGSSAISATDSSRAVVIGGGAGAGQSSSRRGGKGGGESGENGQGSNYGTAGGGGTQTGRNSGGNAGANQFNGGNGSGTYGYGGGGGWRGGRSSIGDSSADDDKGAGGGSGYVKSTMSNRTLTQGGGAASGSNGCVKISSI